MKKLTARAVIVVALVVVAVATTTASARPDRAAFASYRLDNLDSLGGTSSVGFSVNDRGWAAGRSNLSGNQKRHATLWRNGALTDLDTLGGANSAVLWPVKNIRGIVSGIARRTSRPVQREVELRVLLPDRDRTRQRAARAPVADGVTPATG